MRAASSPVARTGGFGISHVGTAAPGPFAGGAFTPYVIVFARRGPGPVLGSHAAGGGGTP